ncbi:MAG: hypothetical protein DHS20C05_22220 [Hyphococcus sp.]|nr:MAG: hypothetical protein DHS20C05_22220 [Marinicaulis sp.]
MSKLLHLMAAGMLAAFAMVSFVGLATAAPDTTQALNQGCANAICILALF